MNQARIQPQSLRGDIVRTMRAHGVDEVQAESVAANLVWNELIGRANFGVERLPILLRRVKRGVLRCPCHPVLQGLATGVARLDGDNGFGHHVARLAMQHAIERARENGIGVVGVHNSNFFGSGAYFVNLAAEAGMIGIAASNSFPKVAAHGGLEPVLGTNPFAFGAPRTGGRSLLVDMATSALAGSTVRWHLDRGLPLPEGLVIDGDGRPVTDPRLADQGALLPFAGAKGFGLALMVEVLAGVITGSGVANGVGSMYKDFSRGGDNGHFMLAIDIERWMPRAVYEARIEGLMATVKASHPQGEVLVPGEIRWRNFEDNTCNGIALGAEARKILCDLAAPENGPARR